MIRILALAAVLVATPAPQAGDGWAGLLAALQLPALVTEARGVGITEGTLRGVLDGLLRRGVAADDAVVVLREEIDAVHAGGRKDNFGAFVQRNLDAGLRGQALAAAIREEHRRMGIGRKKP
ncbi:MAG: hypothetical protein ACYC6F_07990 [Longimicrobiales bacterium]